MPGTMQATGLPAMRSEDATRFTLATVMVCEVDPARLEVIRAALTVSGYDQLVTASNVDTDRTLALLARHDPDVLFLGAPGGLSVLERVREHAQWRNLPVIMLLDHLDGEGKSQALALGASDTLSRPIDPSDLALRLRNALGYKAYEDRLLRRDPLTGLPNRGEFMRRVQAVLWHAERPGTATPQRFDAAESTDVARSLLLLDLDRFKQVNDSVGHPGGDAMLVEVAQRLSGVIARHGGSNRRAGSRTVTPWLARIDGNRFMALLPGAPDTPRHVAAMGDLVEAFRRPFHLNRREFHIGASFGVVGYPADGNNVELLVQRAELALNQAKKRGGNTVEYFAAEMQTRAAERLALENQLRYAIRRKELRLYYQPKVDCTSLRMVGVEALIRWQHPEHGLMPPQDFIPLAEETGLIDNVGEWALREACRQGAEWLKEGLPPLQVAVNLSAAQLWQGKVTKVLAQVLSKSGFPAANLTLELTESMLMTAGDQAVRTIAALKGLGVALSLDDFGTGYSPLTYLRQLPIDEIKIDRSFVHGLPAEADSAAITEAIISLAGALGLKVVAEGVETTEELTFLRRFTDCCFQGYLFSRPVPAAALTEMLRSMRQDSLIVPPPP